MYHGSSLATCSGGNTGADLAEVPWRACETSSGEMGSHMRVGNGGRSLGWSISMVRWTGRKNQALRASAFRLGSSTRVLSAVWSGRKVLVCQPLRVAAMCQMSELSAALWRSSCAHVCLAVCIV